MFNENSYNIKPFNIRGAGIQTITQDDIVYNGISLQNENLRISSTNFDNSHTIENTTYNRPLTDGIGELNYYFREKLVVMSGTISYDSGEELNTQIDRLKKIILQNSENLDIKVNGTIRRANATCVNPTSLFSRKHYNINFIPIILEFRTSDFFKEIVKQNILLTNQTSGFVEELYNNGSAKANPLITIIFNSSSSVNEIVFINSGESITISESIYTGDIIQIDTEETQVLINDVEVDYSGVFPRLDPGTNSYEIEINGIKDFNFNLSYFNTYL